MAKIGVISGTFHPDTGGPATYLYHLLPTLQQRGHEIRLLTYGDPDPAGYGYPVQRISRRQPLTRRLWHFTRAAWALARWADVLYINGYVLPLPLIRPVYRRRIIIKIVGDLAWEYADRNRLTTLDVVAFQQAKLPWRLTLLRWFYHQIVRLSDAVLVPGEHLARLVRGWGIPANRVQVIYNGVPEAQLEQVDRQTLRRELNLPLYAPLLVSIARLTPVKGVHVALKALALLPSEMQMVIVGEGEKLAELQALAPPGRVHFVGRQQHDIALRYLRAADIFVLSSYTEGLSHVLLEALQVGTPIVATAVGGNPEVVTDRLNALLVPPDNPQVLAAAIERLYHEPEFAAQLAAAGRIRSMDFRWATTVQRTEALLTGDAAPPTARK